MKTALVLGGGGFIGGHIISRLKKNGYWVRAADIKMPEFNISDADEFFQGDLREQAFVRRVLNKKFDEVYQLAADMGGAGYINTGNFDADVMNNSALINLLVADEAHKQKCTKIFFSSSACVYNEHNQMNLTIQIVAKPVLIQHFRIANMGGRSCLASVCITHITSNTR